jgi:hypothetical protein
VTGQEPNTVATKTTSTHSGATTPHSSFHTTFTQPYCRPSWLPITVFGRAQAANSAISMPPRGSITFCET